MSHFVLAPLKRRAALALLGLAVGFGPLFLSSAIAHDFKQGSLTIDHPTVTPTRGIVPVNAGYMTILNAGTNADRLISATSPDAGRIELHESSRSKRGIISQSLSHSSVLAGSMLLRWLRRRHLNPSVTHIRAFSHGTPSKPLV